MSPAGIPPSHPLSRTHLGVRLRLAVPVISRLKLSCMARIRLGGGECWSGTTSRLPPRCTLARQGTESSTRARWPQTTWQGARPEPSKLAPPTLTTQSPRVASPLRAALHHSFPLAPQELPASAHAHAQRCDPRERDSGEGTGHRPRKSKWTRPGRGPPRLPAHDAVRGLRHTRRVETATLQTGRVAKGSHCEGRFTLLEPTHTQHTAHPVRVTPEYHAY